MLVIGNLHERHKMMIWRIAVVCLPTKDKLSRFVDATDTYCPLYKMETETSLHLFALCPVAKAVWFNSKWGLRMDSFGFSSEVDFILFLCSPPPLSKPALSKRWAFIIWGHSLWWNLEAEKPSNFWRPSLELWWSNC